ncbi:MAG: QueT transporter family protein [Clostridia bacterium]|nr:QueT transporter family protein [Clostridia bacterium]
MKKNQINALVGGAMIAALYAAATYASAVLGIAYGQIQFRFSEALTVLSVFTPAAIPGLTVGCILGNLSSPYGIWDITFGSLATLLAAVTARKARKITVKGLPIFSIIMPVIFNALIVGAEITLLMPAGEGSLSVFLIAAAEVAAGELVVCLVGGIPLFYALKKARLFDVRLK